MSGGPSAGDLLCAAVDRWVPHVKACNAEGDCPDCDALFNQVILAWKVWASSRYKAATAHALAPWLRHHSTCARVTDAGECNCGLNSALLTTRANTTT